MKPVMTTASSVKCAHTGKVGIVGNPKLTVKSNPVLVEAGVKDRPVAGCVPPPGTAACTTVKSVLPASKVTKLMIKGEPVLGEPLTGMTDIGPLVALLAGQTKLKSA